LNAHFVCLADDCDAMAPAVRWLGLQNMASARTLPFLLVTDADGHWITGASGGQTAEGLLQLLRSATAEGANPAS
jgi:hypothetical protein